MYKNVLRICTLEAIVCVCVCVCVCVYKRRSSQIINVFVGCSLWHLISPTRDWTKPTAVKKKIQNPNH